ncbi:UNC-50 family domain-containing protein [Ditylenchus destructor]|nr:UNC-50 family domain-containing protein [Ditylenchus destructor]
MIKDFGKREPLSTPRGITPESPTTSAFSGLKRGTYPTSGYRSGYSTPGSTASYIAADKVGCFTAVRMTAIAKLSRYFRRLVHIRQMDFEFAAWQMLYLLIHPQKVYRNFMYRKRTKDQWARDDPAFLVLLAASLLGSSVLFALALGLPFSGFITFFLWAVFIDCIMIGLIVATLLWFISNKYLRRVQDQDVEWGYCFDVHLNAFFPMLVLLHVVIPLLFYGVIDYPNFFARLVGNSIWCAAIIYYIYITFLGYTALPILKKTHVFLYPITFIFIFFVATISAGWNVSVSAMNFYHFRVMNEHRQG